MTAFPEDVCCNERDDRGGAGRPPDFLLDGTNPLVVRVAAAEQKVDLGLDPAHCSLNFVAHLQHRLFRPT
jgi:hypothetical protein